MDKKQIDLINKEFFTNGCQNLVFPDCQEIHENYKKAIGGKGCSRCKMGRVKRQHKPLILKKIQNLDFEKVFKQDSQH